MIAAGNALAQENGWKQVCAKALAAPLTVPPPAEPGTLQGCESTALYYGFDHATNWTASLQCAWFERDHSRSEGGDFFAGPAVLSMLYANGRGTTRNYDLAIRFACENTSAADAEMELRIAHLEHLRDAHTPATNFDLCDDATSGRMQGACESIHQRFLNAQRSKDLETIAARWSDPVKAAFQSLDKAEKAFEDSRTRNEVDLSGSGRAAFELEEQGRLRDQFLINLRRCAKGDIPPASAGSYRTADSLLNAAYQNVDDGTRYRVAVRYGETVRNPRYRARLACAPRCVVEFVRVAYPRVTSDSMRTQITRLRTHQIESLRPR